MELKKSTEKLIIEIKKEIDNICEKLKNDHHKQRDGELFISYDGWNNEFYVEYSGYYFDNFTIKNKYLNEALEDTLFKLREIQTDGRN